MASHPLNSDSTLARTRATCQTSNCGPRCSAVELLSCAAGRVSLPYPAHNPAYPHNHPARPSILPCRGTGEQSRERHPVSRGGSGEDLGGRVTPRVCPRTGPLLWAGTQRGRRCRRLAIALDPVSLNGVMGDRECLRVCISRSSHVMKQCLRVDLLSQRQLHPLVA